jgi:hypothetical protein
VAAPCFIAYNALSGSQGTTTAAPAVLVGQTTGTSLHTMLQIKTGTPKSRIIEWGYAFANAPTAVVNVGLVTTGAVFATLNTALAAGDIMSYNDATGPASQCVTGSTSGSAFYTGTTDTESTISANTTRYLSSQYEWGTQFREQFPLGREPEIAGGTSLRVIASSATAIVMLTWVAWEE